MKKSLAVMLALIMMLCMIPATAFAAGNSTVVLHPSVNHTVTGVKVKVGDKIDGYTITGISGYDITVDLGKYNVNNGTFRLPYAKDIWEGVDNNKVDYISWAGSGSNRRSEGASALLANGKNTAYYYFKGAPTYKTFTLKYDANGGTGAPAEQTYTASSQYEKSHTFKISNVIPTRKDYEFKGWAETPNAAAATRQPGGSIVVTGTTTLYAVWETKSEPTPEKPKPETTPEVPGLTDINAAVKVKCETAPEKHEEKTFGFNWFSCEVGEVTGNAADGYTCAITILPGEYVTAYNVLYYSGHTLVGPESYMITLNWNAAAGQWKYIGNELPVTFTVKCETSKPNGPKPEDTSKPFIELTGEKAVKVQCTNDKSHTEKSYGLKFEGYTIGDVQGDEQTGYTCDITVQPDEYVSAYNETYSGHTLVDPSQTGTIKLEWDKENQEWKLATPSGVPVVFTVKCDNTQPPLDNITIEVSKTWHDDSNTVAKPKDITVILLADGKEVDRATITPDASGAWSHSFGAKPANDNGKPINYTVKEENVPGGWTPYYYTAGLFQGKLIFQIHNVPTENTREIRVTKKVSGDGADKAKVFDFKVTLLAYYNGDGETPVGYYPLGGTHTFSGVTFTNGVADFKLADGQSFEIKGIPSDLQYKVEELNADGYTVKVNGKEGGSISGAFTDAKTVDIAFENVKESVVTPTPTPGGGHYHPDPTPVPPIIVNPPKTGDMTIWQSILRFFGIR